MKPLADCRLYTLVDTAYLHGRAPEIVAQQLCDGGADLIQLRAKKSSLDEIRAMARKILPITRRASVGLVINDYPDIAREVGADFCHLGQEDISELRIANCELRIGISTHSPEQARRAMAAGPAYIAVGPIYATNTKPTVKPVTLEYVRWATMNVTIPWFAIGGINLENLGSVLAAGAKRICVVSAILDAKDVTKACAEFKRRLV
jgi:thiamine-phosphate pyrophosphorylase